PHSAQIEWTPPEVKPKDGKAPAGQGRGGSTGRTPLMVALQGGKGAPLQAGPGYNRNGPPPFRQAGSREPSEAIKVLLAAGANPNAKAGDGSTPLHQAVQAQQVAIIRALVSAGASLDAVNKDNLTPLLAAEKQKSAPPPPASVMGDPGAYKAPRDSAEQV